MQSGFSQFRLTAAVSSVWRDVNWAVIKGLKSALDFCNVCFLQTGNCQAPSSALEKLLLKKADDDLKIGLQSSDFLEFWINKGLGGEWMPASAQGTRRSRGHGQTRFRGACARAGNVRKERRIFETKSTMFCWQYRCWCYMHDAFLWMIPYSFVYLFTFMSIYSPGDSLYCLCACIKVYICEWYWERERITDITMFTDIDVSYFYYSILTNHTIK